MYVRIRKNVYIYILYIHKWWSEVLHRSRCWTAHLQECGQFRFHTPFITTTHTAALLPRFAVNFPPVPGSVRDIIETVPASSSDTMQTVPGPCLTAGCLPSPTQPCFCVPQRWRRLCSLCSLPTFLGSLLTLFHRVSASSPPWLDTKFR